MEWSTSTHPISDIRDWKNDERLELQPDFQRNVVWSRAAQIALIDTILHNIPIPKIYMKAYIQNEKTYRVVIDGQQRLTAINDFITNKFKLKTPHTTHTNLNDKYFKDLPGNTKTLILSYKIDFNEIFNPSDDDVRDLYARVNKYTVQLNKQELRRADFPGEFIDIAENLSDLDFFADCNFFSAGQKRRMLDVEYIGELLCIILEGEQDKKESLDDFCEKYRIIPHSKTQLEAEFKSLLDDISLIFSNEISLKNTRFRQKADFYSLFSCILEFKHGNKTIVPKHLNEVRKNLIILNNEIAPHSETEKYSEYAIRCISDANSKSSREWRRNFLHEYIEPAYTGIIK